MQEKLFLLVRKYWWLAAVGLPVVYILALIVRYAVNIPQWDEMDMTILFRKHDSHTLGFSDFWVQHNEHRILFPNLILFSLAFITRWNVAAEPFVSFVLACGILVLALMMVWGTFKTRAIKIGASIFAAFLLFSPMQGENWLWGWQVEWFFEVFCVMLTIWSLCYWPKKFRQNLQMPAAIIAALLATYSLGSGPFIWLAGAAILILQRVTLRKFVIWAGSAVVALGLYYSDYNFSGDVASKSIAVHQPHRLVEYMLTYIGHPLGWEKYSSVVFGVISSLVLLWVLWRVARHRAIQSKVAGWFALMVLGLLGAFFTGIGRLEFGVAQAIAPRYMLVASLFTLGLVMSSLVVLENYKHFRSRLYKPTLIALAIVFIPVLYNYKTGTLIVRSVSIHYRWIQQCTHATPDQWCLMNVFPDTERALRDIQYLRDKHWGGY